MFFHRCFVFRVHTFVQRVAPCTAYNVLYTYMYSVSPLDDYVFVPHSMRYETIILVNNVSYTYIYTTILILSII